MKGTERTNRICAKLNAELGPELLSYLQDPDIIEIMLNPDGRLWLEGHDLGLVCKGEIPVQRALSIIGTVAAACGTVITKQSPIVSGELPTDGSRFQGMIPPIAARPVFTIRKKAIRVFGLDEYVSAGILSSDIANRLRTAVLNKKNILIAGGTGSGKTTLANALIASLHAVAPDDRVVILEDTAEIQCEQENAVILRTSDHADMDDLLRATMRMRPDRILVGEVRGGEALTLLKSWNTGHPGGLATVHANSARSALDRLEQLIQEVSASPMGRLIAEAVDLVLFIAKAPGGREVKELIEVTGHHEGEYQLATIFPKTTQKEETHHVA